MVRDIAHPQPSSRRRPGPTPSIRKGNATVGQHVGGAAELATISNLLQLVVGPGLRRDDEVRLKLSGISLERKVSVTSACPIIFSSAFLAGCGAEQVDAFYYPDKNDLTKHQFFENVGSLDACRTVVLGAAASTGDPDMRRGAYECGIAPTGDAIGDFKVYKRTEK